MLRAHQNNMRPLLPPSFPHLEALQEEMGTLQGMGHPETLPAASLSQSFTAFRIIQHVFQFWSRLCWEPFGTG